MVSLASGDPPADFERCVQRLTELVQTDGAEIVASNQVIGEAYIALQHHYGVTKGEARGGLAMVLRSGLVSPANGLAVFDALEAEGGCGLLDRLIAGDYRRADLIRLTLDRKMASLPKSRRLKRDLSRWASLLAGFLCLTAWEARCVPYYPRARPANRRG